MFTKVLVALDFSHYSQGILDHIRQIPGIHEAVLLHIVDASRPSRNGQTHEQHIGNIKTLMAGHQEALEKAGLKVQTSVDVIVNPITQGDVAQAILEMAETENVSLIVIGARGINPIKELLLGSVSSFVLRYAKTNVLVLHFSPDAENRNTAPVTSRQNLFSKILMPTDFSKPAGDAISLITSIPTIGEVILLHIVSRVRSRSEIEACVAEGQRRLEDMKKNLSGPGISINIHVSVGDPADTIVSVAEEDDVSLIALSAFGTDWLREMLLGSTTFTVVRRSKKPVLIIRTGQET